MPAGRDVRPYPRMFGAQTAIAHFDEDRHLVPPAVMQFGKTVQAQSEPVASANFEPSLRHFEPQSVGLHEADANAAFGAGLQLNVVSIAASIAIFRAT